MRLPKYKVRFAADVIYRLVVSKHIPNRILLIVNDLMSHRLSCNYIKSRKCDKNRY